MPVLPSKLRRIAEGAVKAHESTVYFDGEHAVKLYAETEKPYGLDPAKTPPGWNKKDWAAHVDFYGRHLKARYYSSRIARILFPGVFQDIQAVEWRKGPAVQVSRTRNFDETYEDFRKRFYGRRFRDKLEQLSHPHARRAFSSRTTTLPTSRLKTASRYSWSS